MSNEKVLKVENVTMQFGGVIAVDNMNLEVNKGEIVSLIGPNGAGKTNSESPPGEDEKALPGRESGHVYRP